ncbi:hypothetical protein N7492_009697 [Penicillium capsulatum]|uniref:Uncharacterized protein n=1 Tax=Penicillium capsulatum TaxID=69766 RepID=A0A9W9HMY4_9EURO|nr:hypothetical protein N7492_009697 [Penicillium capsulatum]KAJ6114221.1 hypothetical protein N7512_007666 [Penicillium capsulatum]
MSISFNRIFTRISFCEDIFMAVTGHFIDNDWNYREILIGFEPLHRTYSGVNLSALLDLNNDTAIIRVLYIAHVIQLSLKQLLGQMKANPKNETTKIWSEARSQSVRTSVRQQKREIIDTLNKRITKASSDSRCEDSLEFHVLDASSCKKVTRQIEYLLWITQPFFKFTTGLSKTTDATIHIVFDIYNQLFEHLENSTRQLQRKKAPWKQLMLKALGAARDKLVDYYGKTDEIHGDLFAIGTMLTPENKLQFFLGKDWDDDYD